MDFFAALYGKTNTSMNMNVTTALFNLLCDATFKCHPFARTHAMLKSSTQLINSYVDSRLFEAA